MSYYVQNQSQNTKPETLDVRLDRIPAELKTNARWVGWRWELRDGDWTKVPIDIKTGGNARSTDAGTWTTWERAEAAYTARRFSIDGLGYILTGDGLVCIDLDNCRDPETGEIADYARELVGDFETYREVSARKTGIHVFLYGALPGPRCVGYLLPDKEGKVEIYRDAKYIAMTGHGIGGDSLIDVANCQEQLDALYGRLFGQPEAEPEPATVRTAVAELEEDYDILRRALDAANGEKFRRLYYGKWQDAYPSHSEADLALCAMLTFWTQDREQIDRIFRTSALMRDKWERDDYRDRVLGRALDRTETYTYNDTRLNNPDLLTFSKSKNGMNEVATDYTRGYVFAPLSSADFARARYEQEWLIDRILVKDQPGIIGGKKKVLKTSTCVDLTVSLGSGKPFLGKFHVPQRRRTVFISGESGRPVLQETARRVCQAKGIRLEDVDAYWDFRLPCLSRTQELTSLSLGLQKLGCEVAILDPLYLCLLAGTEKNAANLYDVGPLLSDVAVACLSAGATPLLVHHHKKGLAPTNYDPPELEDLAFAGVQEFARQWLLFNRRAKYQPGTGKHDLWMAVGGSAGHSGLWALHVDEGTLEADFTGRKWSVEVLTLDEAAREKEVLKQRAKKQSRHVKDQEHIDELLDEVIGWPAGKKCTADALRRRLGWYINKYQRVMSIATEFGLVDLDGEKTVSLLAEGKKRIQNRT